MFTRISLDRLYVGSVYKVVFIGLACFFVPLTLVFGLLALFGADMVFWNGQAIRGISGLLLSPVIGAMVVGFLSIFLGTACVVGLWLYSKFKPLSLWGKNVAHHSDEVS